ncbi:EpsG family protein [Enterococcus hulanensis]|uniref:EpsG family protein n=1 Tax=Enterococcus hulanensis TaxID=2559929 RepID=UPI0035D8E4A2
MYTIFTHIAKLKNKEKILYIAYTVQLSLIAGLRSFTVGSDTLTYNNIFLSTINKSYGTIISTSKFSGYELVMKLFSTLLNSNNTLFLFFIALITNGIFFYCAYKLKISQPFCVVFFYFTFYYFFQSMNMTRQTFAMALCVLSLYLFSQKKIFLSLTTFIFALLTHSTSIVAIIFPVLYKIHWTKKKYFALALVTLAISLLYHFLIDIFVRFFDSYDMYINSTVDYSSNGGRVLLVLFYSIILIMGIFYSTKKKNYSQLFMTLQGILVLSCILGFLFSSDQLMVRVQMYFEIFLVYYIPMLFIPHRVEFDEAQPVFSFMIIPIMLLSIIPLILQLLNNYGHILPYKFIL